MHGNIPVGVASTRKRADQSDSKSGRAVDVAPSTDQTDSDPSQFFARAARGLLGKDAGFALHLATGFEERTCYRYASGERMPPAFLLRELLRSDAGEAWLNATMDGCTAQWWLDSQRERRVGASAIAAMGKPV